MGEEMKQETFNALVGQERNRRIIKFNNKFLDYEWTQIYVETIENVTFHAKKQF